MEKSIWRKIVKETEKAYLVEYSYCNRRDGSGVKFKWVAKKVCGEVGECALGKYVEVPEHILGSGIW